MRCCVRSCLSGKGSTSQRLRCGEAHRQYEPPLGTSASAHPLPMAMETWPGRMSSMFAPAIFIRPGDRIAPTATRYPAPSQPPQQERSGEGKLRQFLCSGHEPILFVSKKVFEPDVYSLERLAKS